MPFRDDPRYRTSGGASFHPELGEPPPPTPPESPFRQFEVRCLRCGSYQLRMLAEYDEDEGALVTRLACSRCRNAEVLKS